MSAAKLASGACIDADVCVIGAGAAGLTLARELDASSLRVCVLESGSRAPSVAPDPALQLDHSQLPIKPLSRARGLGGSTALWLGKWKALDDIDFAPRDWIAVPGWPISRRSLDAYYLRAAVQAGLSNTELVCAESRFADAAITAVHFLAQAEPLRRWGAVARRALAASANVEVYLDAHVMHLECAQRRIVRVRLGRDCTVTARRFVLATGGIDNARLLLISQLGNRYDQVGRCFMDHPKFESAMIETYAPLDADVWRPFDPDAARWLGLRLSDALQRMERVLNPYVLLKPTFESGLPRRLSRRLRRPRQCRLLRLRNYLEQEPRAENRVTLSTERDPYGQPRATVAWRLSALEQHSLQVLHRHLARSLQRAGLGELHSPLLHAGVPFPAVRDASHHMGTTRMGSDPRSSVVDADCRLHEADNLYLAGSSVFPTSGYANPMATIVALAIRLADHLKEGA